MNSAGFWLFRKAMHEASHAGIAFLEGVGVDFVTIDRCYMKEQWCEGFCCFDRELVEQLKANDANYIDRIARALLAGRASDMNLLEENRMSVTQEIRDSWAGDTVSSLREFPTWPECKAWIDGLVVEVRSTLRTPAIRCGIEKIATLLIAQGRIDGPTALKAFLGDANSIDEVAK